MDRITEAELEGRLKFLHLVEGSIATGKRKVEFAPIEEKHDAMMTAETISIVEIKNITRPYTKYKDFMIDLNKVVYLQDRGKEEGRIPYLVCFFTDCIIIWDLTSIPAKERQEEVSCTRSCRLGYRHGQTPKTETFLKREEAVWTTTIS